MPNEFQYDVFLGHSAKDKAVVRDVAERLRHDELKVWFNEWVLKPGDSIPANIEEGLEHSRVLVLCMSANAFSSDWAQLEAGTFRFRDPLNKDRRFIPLRLDDTPIKGSLAQFLYINWLVTNRGQEYLKLLEACRSQTRTPMVSAASATGAIRTEQAFSNWFKQESATTRNNRISIGPLELSAKFRAASPLGEYDIKKEYVGCSVGWWTVLTCAHKHRTQPELLQLQLCPDEHNGETTPIACTIKLRDYPQLRDLKKGTKVLVEGHIADFDLFGITLSDAKLQFSSGYSSCQSSSKF